MKHDVVTIVSGLPRSGTSMMMRMLEAGGLQVLTDNIRRADDDNPDGYYEFERVKQLKSDRAWLEDAKGKVVKMVSALLIELPPMYTYKVVFMRRKMEEILASQRQMLVRQGKPADSVSDERMAAMFEKHLRQIEIWIAERSDMDAIYVDYNQMLKQPAEHVKAVNVFLGHRLDTEAMAGIVNPALYRQRR
jgi:hypothetical protein